MAAMSDPAKHSITIIYDGDCPFCNAYVHLTRLKQYYTITLLNAREHPGRVRAFQDQGYNLDEGFLVIAGETTLHGDEAMAFLTQAGEDGLIASLQRLMFATPGMARVSYRAFSSFRNLTLRILGVPRIHEEGAAPIAAMHNRFESIYILAVLTLLAFMSLSLPVWMQDRSIPPLPLWDVFTLPLSGYPFLLATMVLALITSLYRPLRRYCLPVSLLVFGIYVCSEQQLLQPYLLMSGFTLGVLWLGLLTHKKQQALNAIAIMLAGIYLYSGIQKCNVHFFDSVFPWFVSGVMGDSNPITFYLGLIIPFFEASIGICLLHPKLRKWGIIGAAGMHAFALLMLGPLGHNWNGIVWPWNLSMFLSVCIVFVGNNAGPRSLFNRSLLPMSAVLVFWVLPLANFVARYDHYLSYSLYSGVTEKGIMYLDNPRDIKKLPPIFAKHYYKKTRAIPITNWHMAEARMMPLPQPRYFRHITRSLCSRYGIRSITLVITYRPRFDAQHKVVEKPCSG
jgi:predicted DCC family thiol-disulfide oxidoreductase YuxK